MLLDYGAQDRCNGNAPQDANISPLQRGLSGVIYDEISVDGASSPLGLPNSEGHDDMSLSRIASTYGHGSRLVAHQKHPPPHGAVRLVRKAFSA